MSKPSPSPRGIALGLSLFYAVLSIVIRLIPYGMRPPNVAANGSMGLFGGARLPLWQAIPLQLAALIISDLLLRLIFGWQAFNPAVYASFLVYLLLGRALLKDSRSPARVALVSFLGSLQFFLITNFFTWWGDGSTALLPYEPTFAGLLTCYAAALPFLGFTIAGDLGFSAVLFGAEVWLHGLVHGTEPVTEEVTA